MGRKLIVIFKIRKRQGEQGVGGELRVQTAWRDAAPVQKRNLELCKRGFVEEFSLTTGEDFGWKESKFIKNISVSL